jgi:hypothetical protein
MRTTNPRPPALVGGLILIVACALAALAALSPGQARADAFLPMLMNQQGKPFATVPTEPATATRDPRYFTDTPRPPTRTQRATNTPPPTATEGPSPTPTLAGGQVNYPTDPGTIVIQIGWTDMFGGTFSNVWEEMNGTPWVTVYGDGRVIASKSLPSGDATATPASLPNREQDLYVGQADEHTVQMWMRGFAFESQYFAIPLDLYTHPKNAKGKLHFYVAIVGGAKRLSLNGFRTFERDKLDDGPEMPYTQIVAVLKLARQIEGWVKGNLGEPYAAEQYTIISQEEKTIDPSFPIPRWEHNLNIRAIAEAAPTAASNYEDKVPGHSFQSRRIGEEVRAIVLPEADLMWGSENRAALFSLAGRRYVVGARQEVPGGSLFLPQPFRSFWYRRDGGGQPPPSILHSLVGALLPGGVLPPPGPAAAERRLDPLGALHDPLPALAPPRHGLRGSG